MVLSKDVEHATIDRAIDDAIRNHPDRRAEIEALKPHATVHVHDRLEGGPPRIVVSVNGRPLESVINAAQNRTPNELMTSRLKSKNGGPRCGSRGFRTTY